MNRGREHRRGRWGCRLLAGGICLLLLALPARAGAIDYEEHFARDAIVEGLAQGLVAVSEDRFRPDDPVTRGEWAVLCSRYLGLAGTGGPPFADLEETDPARGALQAAVSAGILSADPEGRIFPGDPVSRAQAARGVADLLGLHPAGDPGAVLLERGWLWSPPGEELDPDGPLTRGEAVYLLAGTTGRRIGPGEVVGSALDATTLPRNAIVLGGDVQLQRIVVQGDLLVSPQARDALLVLRRTRIEGDLIVLDAGEVTIRLENAEVEEIRSRNPSGTTRVIRDEFSRIGNFDQGTPIDFQVETGEPRMVSEALRSPLVLAAGFVVLLLALFALQKREPAGTFFLTAGVGKILRLPEVEGWAGISVRNYSPDIVEVEPVGARIRIRGLRGGRGKIQLSERETPVEEPPAEVPPAGSPGPPEELGSGPEDPSPPKRKKARRPRPRPAVVLNVVVVEPDASRPDPLP